MTDNVNNPNHYRQGEVECIDAIQSAVVGASPMEAVFVANIIKYVWRYRRKNGIEDLKKARWYLDALIKQVEADPVVSRPTEQFNIKNEE